MKRRLSESSADSGDIEEEYGNPRPTYSGNYLKIMSPGAPESPLHRIEPLVLEGHPLEELLRQIIRINEALRDYDCRVAFAGFRELLEDRLFEEINLKMYADDLKDINQLTMQTRYGELQATTPQMLVYLLRSIPYTVPSNELKEFGKLLMMMISKVHFPSIHDILSGMCSVEDKLIYHLIDVACQKCQAPLDDPMDGGFWEWDATDWIKMIRELDEMFPAAENNAVLELFVNKNVDIIKTARTVCHEHVEQKMALEKERMVNIIMPVAVRRADKCDYFRLVAAYEVMDFKPFINKFVDFGGILVVEKFFDHLSPGNKIYEEITYHVIKMIHGKFIEPYAVKWLIALASRTREQMAVHRIGSTPWDESHKALDALIALMKNTNPQVLQKKLMDSTTNAPARFMSAETQMMVDSTEALSSELRVIHRLCGDLVYNQRFEKFSNLFWRYKRNGVV